MMITGPQVLDEMIDLMTQLAGDWDYTGQITPETRLLADLAMESLDLVVLGTSIQERYGRLPFAEFLAEIGQRPVQERDISVGELVTFVCRYSARAAGGGSQ
jgi:acyl carrier protein